MTCLLSPFKRLGTNVYETQPAVKLPSKIRKLFNSSIQDTDELEFWYGDYIFKNNNQINKIKSLEYLIMNNIKQVDKREKIKN